MDQKQSATGEIVIKIFVTDEAGNRTEIKNLYWFEENGVQSFAEAEGHYGEKYEFEIFVDGKKVYPVIVPNDPKNIKAADIWRFFNHFENRKQEDNSAWLCKECWQEHIIKVDGEAECFTDANWFYVLCFVCEKTKGEHHLVNVPSRLLEMKRQNEKTNPS